MNEIYIDNPEAFAIEITMTGIRLSIGNTACEMPMTIARSLALTIQTQIFQSYQMEANKTFQQQHTRHSTRSLFDK